MMSHGVITCRFAVSAGSRFLSTTATTALALGSEAVLSHVAKGFGDQVGASRANLSYWLRVPLIRGGSVRNSSTISVEQKEKQDVSAAAPADSSVGGNNDGKGSVSYWSVEPAKIMKPDGTEWRWNCFRPWETYQANLSINLNKHHAPATNLDRMAYWTVKILRWPTDIFFQGDPYIKFGFSIA